MKERKPSPFLYHAEKLKQMQLQEIKLQYQEEEKIFSFQDTLLDNVSFKVFVECGTDKFVQFQKDILEDFVADF